MVTTTPTIVDANEAVVRVADSVGRIWLRLAERKLLLALGDIVWVNFAFAMSLIIQSITPSLAQSSPNHLIWFISLMIIWGISSFLFECYNLYNAVNIRRSLARISAAAVVTSVLFVVIPYVTPSLPASRSEALIFPLLLMAGLVSWRSFYAGVFARPNFQQRALIIGTGPVGRKLVRALSLLSSGSSEPHRNIGYYIVGFVDENMDAQPGSIEDRPILGSCRDLTRLVRQQRPHELIIADELIGALAHSRVNPGQPQRRRQDVLQNELFAAILECSEMGISVTTTSQLYEQLTGRIPVEHIGRAINVALPFRRSAMQRFYLMLRRLFDISVSLLGCLLLALVIPCVWLTNRLSSPGPLFYRQVRVGKGGQTFSVLKFRSMIVDAEKYVGMVWASENDPRITPIGRLLRKTRLDEIPQFWNIIRGDMSLIGPRPERPFFVDQLAQEIPFYRARHAVKPGLTGWAQVKYEYGASVEDALMKLQYDLYYIKHQSVLLDLDVLFKTVSVVVGFKGR
jgi:exopolysaccharide biosynthesis polyprenyl glycosylphosphotransferase